jgi:abortive infection bacteriophage resistance protein
MVKQPTTYAERVDRLREHGCFIDCGCPDCEDVLRNVNYYRLSAYFLPFKRGKRYMPGLTFSRVYSLYEFDRKLRNIFAMALEEVEVYLRSGMSYMRTLEYGAFGYLDAKNYRPHHDLFRFNETFQREVKRNEKSLFVKRHIGHYNSQFPIWVAVELFSFGTLSLFFSDQIEEFRLKLSRELFHTAPANIMSWLR